MINELLQVDVGNAELLQLLHFDPYLGVKQYLASHITDEQCEQRVHYLLEIHFHI